MYVTKHYTIKTYGSVELPPIHPKIWNYLLVRVHPSEPRKSSGWHRKRQSKAESLSRHCKEEKTLHAPARNKFVCQIPVA
jgi:hypothetical protein